MFPPELPYEILKSALEHILSKLGTRPMQDDELAEFIRAHLADAEASIN